MTVYFHVIYTFKFLTSEEFRKEKAAVSLFLAVPNGGNLGVLFSGEMNERVKDFKNNADQESLLRYWINMSLCASNFAILYHKIKNLLSNEVTFRPMWQMGFHRLGMKFHQISIGADKADKNSLRIGDSAVLLAGDALGTVDPSTGLGCNTAIKSACHFWNFIKDYNTEKIDTSLDTYSKESENIVQSLGEASRWAREAL